MKIVYHHTAASLAALLAAASTYAQPEGVTAYEVISIGVVDDDYAEYANSYVKALDEFGRVIGASTMHVGSQGVVWINGRLHIVPPPSGYDGVSVFGISPTTGLLVGITGLDGETYPAAWLIGQGAAVLDNVVGSVPGSCDAIDANDSGWIAGTCYAPATAVLWIGDTPPVNIGHLFAGRTDTWVSAINQQGEIVGKSYGSLWVQRPYLWRDGVMTDIGGEPEEDSLDARGLNNLTEVVGYYPTVERKGYHWAEGVRTLLHDVYPCEGALCDASSINDDGIVVGRAAESTCTKLKAALWERAHDFRGFILNDLIPRHPDVDLKTADDINNAGQIACYAEYDNGDGRGVLVTPYLFNLSDPTPGTAGEISEITVTGLVPGQSVRLIWGTEAGAQPIRPGCDGGTLLIRDPRTSFEPVLADGDGVARFNVRIPPQAVGMTVRYQAVCVETCEISHTVTWEIP